MRLLTGDPCKPAPACSARSVEQVVFGIGLAMVMLLASPSAFAQTLTPEPTGRYGEPPGPLKAELRRPLPPPSPVPPLPPLPPATGAPPPAPPAAPGAGGTRTARCGGGLRPVKKKKGQHRVFRG